MYYLMLNGAQAGPFSLEQLKSLWTEGQANAQTLFWQEGMPEWKPLQSIQHLIADGGESSGTRVIGGFWRRLAAYALDSFILLVVGFVLSLFLRHVFMQMGAWGLLIGLTSAGLYFGLMNSAIGRGQTLGKRVLNLEVIDHEGLHLTPGRSILRYMIFAFPFYLNCLVQNSGMDATSWPALILCVLIFAGSGAITYLYIFNRRTRQSLHDLAVGSYVVRTIPQGVVTAPPLWKGHLIAVGVLVILPMGGAVASLALIHSTFLGNLLTIQTDLINTGKVNSVTVTEGTNWSSMNGKTNSVKILSVNAKMKDAPVDDEAAMREIAAVVLKDYPDVEQDDLLSISVSSGFNIGIYWSSVSKGYRYSPEKWKSMISSAN
jgi:uncharacterized RDD family membrane protein YckC